MLLSLAGTALLMGLAGGPHCVAMCGPACAGVIRVVRHPQAERDHGTLQFHAGRLSGYALAGALAAEAVQGMGWLAGQTAALRPAWTLFHALVLGWGLVLLASGRQPALASSAGRRVWNRVRGVAARPGGVFTTGAMWALMPCGLLYSALLVASLSGGAVAGAFTMLLFGLGSAASLVLAPRLLRRLRLAGDRWGQEAGTRVSGLLVAGAALYALGMDLFHRIAIWCGLA